MRSKTRQSGMYLDNGFSLSDFAQIVQAPLSGGMNQQWLFNFGQEPNGNYVPTAIINAYSRMALDNSNSTTNGQPIDQFQFTGTFNQQWVLLPANAVIPAPGAIINDADPHVYQRHQRHRRPDRPVELPPAGRRL